MYAIIKTGGQQFRVKEGDLLKCDTLNVNGQPAEIGSIIDFSEVLFIADGETFFHGTPHVAKAVVKAEVIDHGRHKKIQIIKFRRRKHHMKRMGHRQNFTQIKITAIHK